MSKRSREFARTVMARRGTVNPEPQDRANGTTSRRTILHRPCIIRLTTANATAIIRWLEAVPPPRGERVDLIRSVRMRCIRMAMGLVGVLGLSATAAAAEDSAFYVGGGVGLYNAQVEHPINAAVATPV